MPWRAALLKGKRVLARCDDTGAFTGEDGRVEVRYRANDTKAYRAAARNLQPLAGEKILPDDHCVEAVAAPEGGSATPRSAARKTSAKPQPIDPGSAQFVAYTDGACSGNPGPCGLGVVLLSGPSRRELSEYLGTGTNNIAELTAILRALEAVPKPDESVLVHTDSQYAIGVLQKGWKAKANQALIAAIKERMQAFSALRLVYVPGHAGVPLNERADELARAAVSGRRSSPWREIAVQHERINV